MPIATGNNDVTVRVGTEGDTSGIEQVEKKLSSSTERMVNASKTLAMGIGAGALAVGGFGLATVKMAADMEQSQIAFTTLLGNGEKARSFLGELQNFAATTPFEFPGLQDTSRKLLAFGFNAEQTMSMMRTLGDATAALGGGPPLMDQMSRALGQMQAKGKVSAEEMMQLAETGIPVWEMLAKKIGTDIPTAMDLASKGAIKGTDGINAVLEGMNAKFTGAMDLQSQTVMGLFSTMKDTVSFAMIDIGNEIIKAFNIHGALSAAIPAVQAFADTLKTTVIPFLKENTVILQGLGAMIAVVVVPAFIAWGVAAASAAVGTVIALGPITLTILAIIAIVTALKVAWDNNFMGIQDVANTFAVGWKALGDDFNNITNTMKAGWKAFGDDFNRGVGWIKQQIDTFKAGIKAFQSDWNNIWGAMGNFFNSTMTSLYNGFSWAWNGIKAVFFGVMDVIGGYFKDRINFWLGLVNLMIRGANSVASKLGGGTIPEIPMLAKGTDNFGGGLAWVGEQGPELVNLPRGSQVIPNNQVGSAGGITINQTNNIYGELDMDQKMRDLVFQVQVS